MGNAISDFDRKKAIRRQEIFEDNLRSSGVDVPTAETSRVPDFATNGDAVAWFNIAMLKIPNGKKPTLYGQPFSIGTGPKISYADRKQQSLLSPDNPFETTKDEGERLLLKKISEKLPFKRGGHVHRFF
jgi:hypothetical protein